MCHRDCYLSSRLTGSRRIDRFRGPPARHDQCAVGTRVVPTTGDKTMTRYFVLATVVCTLATPAAAQSIGVPCGGVLVATNSSTQFGQQGLWLQYTVTSSIPPNLCIAQTYVDAVVASVGGSAGHNQAAWTASIQRQVPVPIPNLYVTNGRHSYRISATFTPVNALASQSAAVVQLYSPPPPDPVAECAANGSDWY